jgi:hypothetical protein
MINLRAGAVSFIHWVRAGRAAAGQSARIDRTALIEQLRPKHPDVGGLLRRMAEDGIADIPQYWSSSKCAAARAAFDRVLRDYPGSIQVSSNGSDRRLYGMESADPLFVDFHADPLLRGVGELQGGVELYNFATLGGYIQAAPGNTGSGDGWHRDAHGFQFKAILYLSDTRLENGPFQYLIGSHRRWRVVTDTTFGNLPETPQVRYTSAEIDGLVARRGLEARSFPAAAGTLLLVNTAGIHRGMPLAAGKRYALTNYYYSPADVGEGRIAQFSPLIPGTAERIRRDLPGH